MNSSLMETEPLFCDLTAIPAPAREGHLLTAEEVFQSAEEVRELANGYLLRLPNEGGMFLQMARFVENERLCCPFFHFGLEVEAHGGPLWLRLTGEGGIKELLKTTLSEQVAPETLKQSFRTGGDTHLDAMVTEAAPRLGKVLEKAVS